MVQSPSKNTAVEVIAALGSAIISDQSRRNGRPIQAADAWIAATAISLGIPLVTNNRSDFAGIGNLQMLPESAPSGT